METNRKLINEMSLQLEAIRTILEQSDRHLVAQVANLCKIYFRERRENISKQKSYIENTYTSISRECRNTFFLDAFGKRLYVYIFYKSLSLGVTEFTTISKTYLSNISSKDEFISWMKLQDHVNNEDEETVITVVSNYIDLIMDDISLDKYLF
jgi:hypothetical protein